MKKVLFTLFISLSLFSIAKASENNNYAINDQQVEQLFTNSVEVSYSQINENILATQSANASLAENKMTHLKSDKSGLTAFLICTFVGNLGIHRIYLGTATFTWIGYILTCGGCGIVSFVDWIELIINMNDVDKFVDNSKFFMW